MVGHIPALHLAGEVIDQLWSHPRLLRRQDEIGDFPHSPFSTFFLQIPYGLLT